MKDDKVIIDFSKYGLDRTHNFTGRDWVFNKINEWLVDPNSPRYFLITGEPGSGKSAIASRLYQISNYDDNSNERDLYHLKQHFLDAVHFCSARDSYWRNPQTFAKSVAIQLARHDVFAKALTEKASDRTIHIEATLQNVTATGQNANVAAVHIENIEVKEASNENVFNLLVREPLEVLFSQNPNAQIIILVDALDEALLYGTEDNIVSLLADSDNMPKGVRFIVTSRPDERVENRFFNAVRFYLSSLEFNEQNRKDVSNYVLKRIDNDNGLFVKLEDFNRRQLDDFVSMVTYKADGNFQYVSFLLNAITNGQQKMEEIDKLPAGLDALYHESLGRRIRPDSNDWSSYSVLLGILSVAEESLRHSQLQAFTGLSGSDLWMCLGKIQQFIEEIYVNGTEQEGEPVYRLYHQSLIDFFHRPSLVIGGNRLRNSYYLPLEDWHKRIVQYYHHVTENKGWDNVDWTKVDDYGLLHLCRHMYALRDITISGTTTFRKDLYELICKSVAEEKLVRFGSYQSFIEDLVLANKAAELEVPSNIVQMIRGYFIYAGVESVVNNVAPQILGALTQLGQFERAAHYAKLITNAKKRSKAWCLIANSMLDQGETNSLRYALKQALDAADSIESNTDRANAFNDLVETLIKAEDQDLATQTAEKAASAVAAEVPNVPVLIDDPTTAIKNSLFNTAALLTLTGNKNKAEELIGRGLEIIEIRRESSIDSKIENLAFLFRSGIVTKLLGKHENSNNIIDTAWVYFSDVDKAVKGGDRISSLTDVSELAISLVVLGSSNYAPKEQTFDTAHAILNNWCGKSWKRVSMLGVLSQTFLEVETKPRALDVSNQALAEAVECGGALGPAKDEALINLSKALGGVGEFDTALKIAEFINDNESKSVALGSTAQDLAVARRYNESLKIANYALDVSRVMPKNINVRITFTSSLAKALAEIGMKDHAMELVNITLRLWKTLPGGISFGSGRIIFRDKICDFIARTFLAMKEFEQCLEYLDRFAPNQISNHILCTIIYAVAESDMKDHAMELVNRLLERYNMISKWGQKAALLAVLTEIQFKLGMEDQSKELAYKAISLVESGIPTISSHKKISLYNNSADLFDGILPVLKALARTRLFEEALEMAELITPPLTDREILPTHLAYVIHKRMEPLVILGEKLIEEGRTVNALELARNILRVALDLDTKRLYLDQDTEPDLYLYISEAMISAAQIFISAGSPRLATEPCNLAAARIKAFFENNQIWTFSSQVYRPEHIKNIERLRTELLTSQVISLSKMVHTDIDIVGSILECANRIPDNGRKAELLAKAAQLLTSADEHQKGQYVLQIALNSAMFADRDSILNTLAIGAPTVAAIDQGHTLWQAYKALSEVEDW